MVAHNDKMIEFESRVILDGSQTVARRHTSASTFESRVILDGSQTQSCSNKWSNKFESRVILDGSQNIDII